MPENVVGILERAGLSQISPDDIYQQLLGMGINLLRIGLILVGAWIALRFSIIFLQKVFLQRDQSSLLADARMQTLGTLIRSVAHYIVYFIAGIMILEELGIKTSSLLAGAGIVGLAVGFGAQNLVRDIISGFFIIFEHQFSVGDYIDAAGVSGKVEEVGLRMTKLKDWGGEIHIIPNGEITRVTNYSRGSMRALIEVGVAYEEDIDRVLEVMRQVCQEVAKDFPVITDGPTVLGVVNLGESEVLIRVVAHTLPFEQWGIERELRKRIKQAFDREKIEIPYPRRMLIIPDKAKEPKEKVASELGGAGDE
jgi:small conductance mechanosensitive channel